MTDLTAELEGLGYRELFQRGDSAALDSIWRLPDAEARLSRLVSDPEQPDLARFLASEVLFAGDAAFVEHCDPAIVAGVYARALQRNLAGMANPWGLPGGLHGPVAEHVLRLGAVAVPAFAGLLGDETPLEYGGSKEATVGNSYSYRVKDVAAAVVAALAGVPLAVPVDPADRDAEIDRLRDRLGTAGGGQR